MPSMNSVVLESKNIQNALFAMNPITDDDAFASNAMGGLLGYTVPSLIDIFSNEKMTYNYYDFNDETLPSANPHSATSNLVSYSVFEVTVQNSDEQLACPTKWGKCRIIYNELATPMYIDTVPSNVAFGMSVNFVMNPNLCHHSAHLPADWDPFYYLKIGDTLTDWEGLVDSSTRLKDWVTSSITTVVGKNKPAKSVNPDVSFSRFGRVNLKESSVHCSFDGTECWRIRVHPKIDNISAATGYLQGG